ncbi:MAG: hypothetical protein R3287_10745 [Anderseniella sp.]|jgi:hypothetical protein|nr:hypothetical protein [Anderseniella sp.]
MSTSGNRNDDTVRQAKADLKRLGEQSEKMLGARHAEDEDDANDPVVIWGKRLGRTVAYLLGAYLIFWFLKRYGII